MTKGARAPCDGLLVSEADARHALRCVGVALPRCSADLALCGSKAAAADTMARDTLQACDDHRSELVTQLEKSLSVSPRPWWDSRSFFFAGGAAVGAGVVVALVYGLSTM